MSNTAQLAVAIFIGTVSFGSAHAIDYLDVDIQLDEVERGTFCESCRTYPTLDGEVVETGGKFTGHHSILRLHLTLDSSVRVSDLEFSLIFMDPTGTQYRVSPFDSVHDDDVWSLPGDGASLAGWHAACKEPVSSISRGGSASTSPCFPLKPSMTPTSLAVFSTNYPGYAQIITFMPNDCDNLQSPEYCGGEWNLDRVDGQFTYFVENAEAYDNHQPGYSDTLRDGVEAGFDAWERLNQSIRFVPTTDLGLADITVGMGGTGEDYEDKTDTFGRVNEVGCLVDMVYDCTITLFVENDYSGSGLTLMGPEMIEFVTAHEIGHLLGFPHHASALHLMYSPLDNTRSWYEDHEYMWTVPDIQQPDRPSGEAATPDTLVAMIAAYEVMRAIVIQQDRIDMETWLVMDGMIQNIFERIGVDDNAPEPVRVPATTSTSTVLVRAGSAPGCEKTNTCLSPTTFRIATGTTVTWDNISNVPHALTSGTLTDGGPDGRFDSSLIRAGATFSHTFDTPGEYPYFCLIHPWVSGTITVQ